MMEGMELEKPVPTENTEVIRFEPAISRLSAQSAGRWHAVGTLATRAGKGAMSAMTPVAGHEKRA
jgi:hypothetical protein